METTIKKYANDTPAVCCMIIIAALALFVTTINGLGPIDDHQFIKTIFQGKSFGAYYSRELGRFFPLTAQEYVFASWLFFPSPRLFFLMSSIKVLAVGLTLLKCLSLTKANPLSIALLWCIPLFSIGFANAAGRLHVGEINILLLTLLFIWSTLAIDSTPSTLSKFGSITNSGGIVALVAAFFYKEVAFVFALVFAASELLRRFRQTRSLASVRLWALLMLGMLYIGGYGLWRVLYCSGSYAAFQPRTSLEVLGLFSQNDPFIIFIIVPLTILRIGLIMFDAKRHTVYDSFLIAASAYTFVFFVLGMFSNYYLLPVYGFAVCGFAGILSLSSVKSGVKRILVTGSGLLCLNVLPLALSDMHSLKLIANNHWRFVHELSHWISQNPTSNGKPRQLVLVGVSPGNGIEVLLSLETFLVSLGSPATSFRVIPCEPTDNLTISTFYGVDHALQYVPQQDDLMIFNPYQQTVSYPPPPSRAYHEVLRSETAWAIPRWSGLEWIQSSLENIHQLNKLGAENMRYSGYAAITHIKQ